MESTLYQSMFEKGEARGEARSRAETIVRVLTYRLGVLDPAIEERIRTLADYDTLACWYEEAIVTVDAEAARRFAAKIQNAPLDWAKP